MFELYSSILKIYIHIFKKTKTKPSEDSRGKKKPNVMIAN